MESNKWYNLYQLFGDSLFELDNHWLRETNPSKRILNTSEREFSATLNSNNISMILDYALLNKNRADLTNNGDPIKFLYDIKPELDHSRRLRAVNYGRLYFFIIGRMEKMYNIYLRANNEIFSSQPNTEYDKDNMQLCYFFEKWSSDSKDGLVLYMPLNYRKASQTDI